MTTAASMPRDLTREALPGGAVSVSTSWAQRALNAAGQTLAVDGRAGPATLAALERFRLSMAPDDPIMPSREGDGASARVIIGAKTEAQLTNALLQRPNQAAGTPSTPRQTIGPNLDPQAPLAPSSSTPSWMPWVLAGGAVAALAAGAWFLFGPGAGNRAAGGKRVNRRRRR